MSHFAVPRSRAWLAASITLLAVVILIVLALGPQLSQAAVAPVPARAGLSLTKEAWPTRVLSGGLVTYTVVLSNSGATTETVQVITDTLDPSLTYTGLVTGSEIVSPPLQVGSRLVWAGAWDVPPTGTLRLQYQVRTAVTPGWSMPCNSVEVATSAGQLGPRAACITSGPEKGYIFLPLVTNSFRLAEFTVVKAVAPAVVAAGPGQVITYTVTVENVGGTAGKLIKVNDGLPAGFTFLGMAPGSDVATNPVGTTGTIYWVMARTVPAGGQVRLIYRVTASETPGSYTNWATIAAEEAAVPAGPATAAVLVQSGILLQDNFDEGIGRWTAFLNDPWKLEPGQWYGGAGFGVGGSGAAVHDCCVGDKQAADALLMYLGQGAEQWTDYRVETRLLLHGGVLKDGTWSVNDGDPIGLWVRGQYDYVEGETIRWQWVTGYYVVVAGKPYRDDMVVRISQMQTLTDCWGDACDNPQNLYTFNNPHLLAEAPVNRPFARDQWYKLTVEVRGPRIIVWLDDQKLLDYVDDKEPFLTGTVGFKTHETWWASFDDLVVTPLP